jgi:hypothetical protein
MLPFSKCDIKNVNNPTYSQTKSMDGRLLKQEKAGEWLIDSIKLLGMRLDFEKLNFFHKSF